MPPFDAATQIETWANANSHLIGDPGTAASLKQVLGAGAEIVTPYHYGADPEDTDWSTDNQTPVQDMLDDCRDSWSGADNAFKLQPHLAFRTWNVADGVSVANLGQPGFRLMGGQLIGRGAGKTVLDLPGVNSPELLMMEVRGAADDPPAAGILTTRTQEQSLGPAPYMRFLNVETSGEFTASAHVALGNEVSYYSACAFVNESPVLTAMSHLNVSDYQSVLDFVGGLASAATLPGGGSELSDIIHKYTGCRFLRRARLNTAILSVESGPDPLVAVSPAAYGVSDLVDGSQVWIYNINGCPSLKFRKWTLSSVNAAAGTFRLSGADTTGETFVSGTLQNATGGALGLGASHGLDITAAYFLAYGASPVDIDMINNAPPAGMVLHGQIEHSPRRAIQVRNPDGTNVIWTRPDIRLTGRSQTYSDEIIGKTGTGQVQIQGSARIVVENMGTAPANGTFNDDAGWALKGGVYIEMPKAAALPDPDALANDDALLVALDRSPAGDNRLQQAVASGLTWDGQQPGTFKNFAYTSAGPHALGSGLPDAVTVQVAYAGVVEVQLPNDLRQGDTGMLSHTAASGYSFLSLPSGGTFAGGQKRTVGQFGVIGWQCVGNPGGAPVVKMIGGEPKT